MKLRFPTIGDDILAQYETGLNMKLKRSSAEEYTGLQNPVPGGYSSATGSGASVTASEHRRPKIGFCIIRPMQAHARSILDYNTNV
jgi:hypothetical protein